MRRSTALVKPVADGPATLRTRSTVEKTAACGDTRMCSSWYAPSRSASRIGGSIRLTSRPAATATIASSVPLIRCVP